jgi:hypothetical protein
VAGEQCPSGKWEDANNGLGVGGTGKDPNAPPSLGSQQVITEPAPYQPWAAARRARVVQQARHRRSGGAVPAAGVPRLVMVSLFPIEIVQTPKRIVFMYEYMNVFRSIPDRRAAPADIAPTYLATPSAAGRATRWWWTSSDSTTRPG